MVKLVSPRTDSKWVYDDENYDLLVGPEPPRSEERDSVVWRAIADFTEGGDPDCALLRGESVEKGLRKVEREFEDVPGAERPRSRGSSSLTHAYQLKRWPPTALLADKKEHRRLATLLLGRPRTVDSLSVVSGISPEICRDFVRRLDEAALLSRQESRREAQRNSGDSGSRKGLMTMIRKRLGIDQRAK